MQKYKNYERVLHADVEESLSKIVNKISDHSVVLDVGCGAGMLGRYLSEKKGCIVDGVDFDKYAIDLCRLQYRFLGVINLETELLTDLFEIEAYDYIVVADVVEHLIDPGLLLSGVRKLVKPSGTIIFSVPNITHIGVGLELIFGLFRYRNNGLLDNTHIRFYSIQNLLSKFEEFGLYICELDSVKKEISETEFSDHISSLFPAHWMNMLIAQREDSLVYQWIISVKNHHYAIHDCINLTLTEATRAGLALLFTAELYWTDKYNPEFTEQKKIIGHVFSKDKGLTVVDFYFSECGSFNGMQQIRIDPISDEKSFMIVNAEILTSEKEVVWVMNPQVDSCEVSGAILVKYFGSAGSLFQATNNDPHWVPKIDEKILCQVSAGWIFRLSMRVDGSLSSFYNDILSSYNREEALAERNLEILNLQQREKALRKEVDDIRLSTSWRITKILRVLSRHGQLFVRFVRLLRKHQAIYPGVRGYSRLLRRCVEAISSGGIKKLYKTIASYERGALIGLPPPLRSPQLLNDIASCKTVRLPKDVAVHAHIYYPDLVSDIRAYLTNIPVGFHFYATTDTLEKAKFIEDAFSGMENILALDVRVTENRGRDVFPMLVALGAELVNHELVLHIHTKRSEYNAWELGGWRRYLMDSLLGNPQRVTAIFLQFLERENLGIFFPDPYFPVKRLLNKTPHANDFLMKKLLRRAGKRGKALDSIDRTFFPAGDMFWFRGKAIKPFVDMKLSANDFEQEKGQLNMTLAHAIERMFPYFAGEVGLVAESYVSNSFFSQQYSALQISLLIDYIEKNLIVNPTIIFDHNGGGGTNTYTKQLVETIHADGGSVLRVYCFDSIWFVQWIADGDGMLFCTCSIVEMFDSISAARINSVIVNSLYGYMDIKDTASRIISLVQTNSATLDVKIHDFFALCPSPHLADYEGEYCFVPQDHGKCKLCLQKNIGWYHHWYPIENRPNDIAEWRKPFSDLFAAATEITVFDQSSLEILRKAFHLEVCKMHVVPHVINYFNCDKPISLKGPLHIGILGTLSHTKGGNIVNELYNHIDNLEFDIPITIVGRSFVQTPPPVKVYGEYDPGDLVEIIRCQGINVILMPSIIPETFSFTISEAMKMGLPIVAFDIGAQGRRVKQYEFGKVVPLGSSPGIILDAIRAVLNAAQEFKK